MKKSLLGLIILIFAVGSAWIYHRQSAPAPIVTEEKSSIDRCLNEVEKRGEYRLDPTGIYLGLVTFAEGSITAIIKDASSCKELFSTGRLGAEYRDVEWVGKNFKFAVVVNRRPLEQYTGRIDTERWSVEWTSP